MLIVYRGLVPGVCIGHRHIMNTHSRAIVNWQLSPTVHIQRPNPVSIIRDRRLIRYRAHIATLLRYVRGRSMIRLVGFFADGPGVLGRETNPIHPATDMLSVLSFPLL